MAFTRRHDKCVRDFCDFMNEGRTCDWRPLKRSHFGDSQPDATAGNLWSDLSIDAKTTSRGFRHHSLFKLILSKYGGRPVLVSRETYQRAGLVTIDWDFFRSLIRAAEKEV